MKLLEKTQEKRRTLLQRFKEKQDEVKNSDSSWKAQRKLLTLINLWKLSMLNSVIIFISIVLMLYLTIAHLILGDFYLIIALICLLAILFVNLVFAIFPIKFSTIISRRSGNSKVFNQTAAEQTTSSESGQKKPPKPVLPQIELAPLKKERNRGGR